MASADAVLLISQARRILIVAHINPDGDALGSALGLYYGLVRLGKSCELACPSPVPSSFSFLPGVELFHQQVTQRPDLLIVPDCSDVDRLEGLFEPGLLAGVPTLNIDHHITNRRFGTVNFIDPAAAAVSEMVLDLLQRLGVAIDPRIATCLLTGLVTDTLGFGTTSVTARTLRAAALLMEAGASLAQITEAVFNARALATVRLWGKVLTEFQVDGPIVWAKISQALLREHGVPEDEVKGLVSFLRGTQGTLVAVLFVQNGNGGVKIEFRSNGKVDVADLAARLGGGGHRSASGCTVKGSMTVVEKRVLGLVRQALQLTELAPGDS